MSQVEEKFRLLIEKYLPVLSEGGSDICKLLSKDTPDWYALHQLAHKMKGSSSAIGFKEYSQLAGDIENYARRKEATEGEKDEEGKSLLNEFHNISANLEADNSTLFTREDV